jgi:hypothetical protein
VDNNPNPLIVIGRLNAMRKQLAAIPPPTSVLVWTSETKKAGT